jgi:hypothetical protein
MSRLATLALVLLSACSFLDTAGDIEFGEGTIPVVEFNQPWPSLDQLIGTSITNPTGGALPGAPTSLNAATLAHVQGLMTIDGECRRTFDQPVIVPAPVDNKTPAAAPTAALRNLHVEVVNCGDPKRCVAQCEGFRGMKLQARVEIQVLTKEQAAQIKQRFPADAGEAIVGVRARFSELTFFQNVAGKQVALNKRFSLFQLGLASAGTPTEVDEFGDPLPDDTVLIDSDYLPQICSGTCTGPNALPPQRFALDNNAPFTAKFKSTALNGNEQWVTVFQRIGVAQADLYSVRLGDAGVRFRFQPELIINAIKVAQGTL